MDKCTKNFSIQRGFTLIELIVVISIIGILSSLLVANFMNVRYKTRDGVRKKDLEQIRLALETYRIDVGKYPETASFPTCGSPLQDPPTVYMEKVPCDPLDGTTDYVYAKGTSDFRYTLSVCLENTNDQDPNATDDLSCGANGKRYTVTNP
ncbi:MAG TPA: prepilin-type N-terminal cleavage/methylation domain-containing protein [Candidatus Levybacteria bacterium]|nr:prepilin-type N-terminal cleavage/methylation domain-containing protein [Candidatus Levybacteria bacterium]